MTQPTDTTDGPIVTTPTGKDCVLELQEQQALSSAELAETTGWSQGGITRVMGELEEQGVVERLPNNGAAYLHVIELEMEDREVLTRREVRNKEKIPKVYTAKESGHEVIRDTTDYTKSMPHHRLIAVAEYGIDEVVGKHIHHENGIPWDNRPENLTPMAAPDHLSEHWHPTEIETVVANADSERLQSALNQAGYSVDLEAQQ